MNSNQIIKPLEGTWFSIYWDDARHYYWNDACVKYTPEQWDACIKDLAELGQKYIVFCNVAVGEEAVYDSKVFTKIPMACDDPIEEVMKACDKYNMHVFMSNDYSKTEYYSPEKIMLPEAVKLRCTIIEELAERYSHHKSFYGWYWAWESCIQPYFPDYFIEYFNNGTKFARTLTPNAKFLTAPYGTKFAVCDDKFVSQLDKLDVDIIAYQDTVGCFAATIDESKHAFEQLRKAHDKVPQRALWADIETFTWEGEANVRSTPLIPAEFSRLEQQMAAVSPYVDTSLCFIFEGLLSKPDSIAYTGYAPAGKYYNDYVSWLKKNHPNMIKKF